MDSDLEKRQRSPSLRSVTREQLEASHTLGTPPPTCGSRYERWARNIKGLEARGIEPVSLEERLKNTSSTPFRMMLTWFSMGMAINNIVTGSLGTLVMKLSFTDAALCVIFGTFLGGLGVGYMSTWGPRSGNRTLVYYSPEIRRWKVWTVTTIGVSLSIAITLLLGAGLGSGVAINSKWASLYDGTPGSLLMAGYDRLGPLGKLCAFINVLTIVSNNAPSSYSTGLNFQMLGEMWLRVPRPVFTTVSTLIYASCAIGGRNSLYEIFGNLMPLIGYWVIIWFTIVVEQDVLFNRGKSYDWTDWNNWLKLPVGVAASTAFLIGWVGAIVGMAQSPERFQVVVIWAFGWGWDSRLLCFRHLECWNSKSLAAEFTFAD
ncbi:hypothetical protein AtubIFM56815_000787 [Aspergillus tubingensis]|uniref:Uncharacterized protein n=1 Tax=Aspergillus tubingensis TaxID=5068 RepID=A0A9W6AES4_ASPTU|nr:hypothetical protein AtubIFM56815_000787 [Aspergillus tubingensis]